VVGYGVDEADLGVNRRQRTPDGGTTMGWNPDGPCDREVAVLRFDSLDGSAIATVVAYACHPTVIGPDVDHLCSDFVGPMRERVREAVGGECLFLQACAGNIFPLEAMFGASGPEVSFGNELAISALRARLRARPVATTPINVPSQSDGIEIWRCEPDAEQPEHAVAAHDLPIRLPLMPPPSLDEIRRLRRALEQKVEELKSQGADREKWNSPWLQTYWAAEIESRVATGIVETDIVLDVQILRIGDITLVGLPVEPFCEIGLQIKQQAPAQTMVLGYTNSMAGYLAVAEEYAWGGYEPTTAQRNFGMPAPFAPEAAEMLVNQICLQFQPEQLSTEGNRP
jgi:neutral ceramidase